MLQASGAEAKLGRGALLALLAYALASIYAAASALWAAPGSFGLTTNYAGAVRSVAAMSPAALAGIEPGDTIRLDSVPFEERRFLAAVNAAVPVGTVVRFRIAQSTGEHLVSLKAIPTGLGATQRLSLLVAIAASLIFVVVGATLIVLRPSRATWGFGLYCLLILPTGGYPFRLPSAGAALASILAYDVAQNLGVVGLIVFALDFPRPIAVRRRTIVARYLPAIFVILAAMTMYPDIANLVLARPAGFEDDALQFAFGLAFALAYLILFDTYRRVVPEERERLRWILVGFGIGLITNYVGNTIIFGSFVQEPPAWALDLLVSLNVLLPLTVAHAVIRHRVLDVNLVIGRALVYTGLTTGLAGIFGFLDWFFGTVLEEFRLTRVAEAAVSIGIAFAFDAIRKRVDFAVEFLFFRKRHAAEERLKRLDHDLPQARSVEAVEAVVTSEVADALTLASAALFRRSGATFARVAAHGWGATDRTMLDEEELTLLETNSQRHAVMLPAGFEGMTGLPAGPRSPIVAIPLHTRAEISGILLYGAHTGGNDLDSAEIELLERIAHSAAVALDEIEADVLREINARQSETIARLERAIGASKREAKPGP